MANKILLEMKYARVIMGLAKKLNIPPLRALELFYHSDTYVRLSKQEGDLHCMGDGYLVDELIIEYTIKQGS